MADARITPIEENLIAWRKVFLDVPSVHDRSASDVIACFSDVPSHLFNGVCAARFDDWEARGREVVDEFTQRAVPWFWWVTPSTTSPELETLFVSRGATKGSVPGMHLDLTDWSSTSHGAVQTAVLSPDRPESVDTLMAGYGLPGNLRSPLLDHASAFAAHNSMSVLAYVEEKPVAGGLALVTGETAGLYMITTRPDYRGQGVGLAVTEGLLEEARRRGASEAILHTSAMGRGVYERIGFEVICETTQYVWPTGR